MLIRDYTIIAQPTSLSLLFCKFCYIFSHGGNTSIINYNFLRGTVNLKKFLALMLVLIVMLSTCAFAASETYIMREKDGFVGVFLENDSNNPLYMTDIVVLSLPEADREMLKEGIRVDGAEALREMLEDFGS